MSEQFQKDHAAGLARLVAGSDVLTARVTVDGETLVVHASAVQKALLALHGDPKPGMNVEAKIEYRSMPASEFEELPDFQ